MSYLLPAIKGRFGNVVYFSSVMPMNLIAEKVDFVKDVHNSKRLSDMIQRVVKDERQKEIEDYIINDPDRFFNSLVLAVYNGAPAWYPADISSDSEYFKENMFVETTLSSVGFLEFSGEETIIAIDGQHRLAGIKGACSKDDSLSDRVSVIFIAHSKEGPLRERTRRLFTVLNKYAKPVAKSDIISLDENDPMAIVTRRLVEDYKMFSGDRILIKEKANINAAAGSITTIENLYDILTVIFESSYCEDVRGLGYPNKEKGRDVKRKDLKNGRRPNNDVLNMFYERAVLFFECLIETFDDVGEYFNSDDYADIAKNNRRKDRGHVLFRPVGLHIFAEIFAYLQGTAEERFGLMRDIPTSLMDIPYNGTIYVDGKMFSGKKAAPQNILLHAFGKRLVGTSLLSAKKAMASMLNVSEDGVELPNSIDELIRMGKD